MFWIALPDFLLAFSTLYMAKLYKESNGWVTKELRSQWKGSTAAGCGNYQNQFMNPQFRLKLTRPAHAVVVLTQVDASGSRDFTAQGVAVYEGGQPMVSSAYREKATKSSSYSNLRTCQVESERLGQGEYLILPTTFDPGPHYGGAAKNERKFKISVFCNDCNFELEALPALLLSLHAISPTS
jgi:hypothetical protein